MVPPQLVVFHSVFSLISANELHLAPNKSACGLMYEFISFPIIQTRPASPPIAIDMLNSGLADKLPC